MDGSRRLSQAIAEGDGISVLVEVADAVAAQAAQDQGAEGLVVRGPAGTIRESCELPVLGYGRADELGGIDAVVVDGSEPEDSLEAVIAAVHDRGLECVLRVSDEDDLEEVLELVDPEIFLLTADEVRRRSVRPWSACSSFLPMFPQASSRSPSLRARAATTSSSSNAPGSTR